MAAGESRRPGSKAKLDDATPARVGGWLEGKLKDQWPTKDWKLVRREDRRSSNRRKLEADPKEGPKDAISGEVGS